jgi:iron(III) transport system substrate-binding protein
VRADNEAALQMNSDGFTPERSTKTLRKDAMRFMNRQRSTGGSRLPRSATATVGVALISLLAACGSIGGSSEPSAADPQETETLEITDELIEAAQEEGSVLVRYGMPADTMDGVATAFYEEYGITVASDRKVGVVATDQFRQESRADNHVVDVMWNVDPPGAVELAEEGFLQRYTIDNIDEFLPPEANLGENAAYVTQWLDVVIQYNPALISTEEAERKFKTWRGLLDPDLANGMIGMNEPAGGSLPFGTYVTWYQDEEYGREFLEELAAQKPRLYPGSAPGREALAAGEIAVYIPNWEEIAMLNFLEGDGTRWTYPDVIPSIAAGFAALSANAPHPNAARLFVAWMLSEEGAQALMNLNARPTRLDVEDSRPAIAELRKTDWWEPMPEDRLRVVDLDHWIENYEELMPDMRQVLGWSE